MDTSKNLPIWTTDSSKYLVNDRFLKLRADTCTTPQGGIVDTYYVMELADWVNCLAIDTDGNVVALRHYRHGVGKHLLELPGGVIDPQDTSPKEAAARELEEEAGYTGGTFYAVGVGYPNPANHTNRVHSFLAVGGSMTHTQNLEVGETITVEKITFPELLTQMSTPGMVFSSLYIATMFYAVNFIRTSSDPALQHLKKFV